MKTRFLIILAVVFIASTALAVPQMINYQGRLADSGGTPVNATVSMTFAIYNTPSGGAPLWTETHSSVMVTDGAFSVALGSFVPIALPFDEEYYLGVQVEADAEMAPRAVLVSVPYAMRAETVEVPLELNSSVAAPGAVINGVNDGPGYGVQGLNAASGNYGILGGDTASVYGYSHGMAGNFWGDPAACGFNLNSNDTGCLANSGAGVYGFSPGGAAILGFSNDGLAGQFWGDVEVVDGYIQLALTTGAPPAADCDQASERGRMKVDNVNGLLYICMNSGWVSK